jgi:CDP-diacylglycerol--serine O-phosphatidyltransferase
MLRTFVAADFITLGNGFCGAGAILSLMQYMATGDTRALWLAIGLLPLALMLDYADGRVARWRRRSSPLGADLDSLADVISFGMAPAALGFAVGLRSILDVGVLLFFVACGISRLARFNVTAESMADDSGKVSHFEGTPIPSSVLLVLLIGWLVSQGRIGDALPWGTVGQGVFSLHGFALLFLANGSAMISKTLRIPKI